MPRKDVTVRTQFGQEQLFEDFRERYTPDGPQQKGSAQDTEFDPTLGSTLAHR